MNSTENSKVYTILDPIQITINNSYKIVDWEKALILKCAYDNPSFQRSDLAKALGIEERTLYRRIKKYKLKIENNN